MSFESDSARRGGTALSSVAVQSKKGMDMSEEEEQRKARERDEIAARVAAFRATQEKFKREREEYCVSTLENARKVDRPSLWP